MPAKKIAETPLFSDANLQGYWELEDANDSGPNGYDLTGTAPSYAAAKFGNGGDFEASSSQYIAIANASCPNLEIAGDKTICAWIKPETTVTNATIAMKSDSTTAYAFGICIYNNAPRFISNGCTPAEIVSTATMSSGNWYFVCAVQRSGSLDIWLNDTKTTTNKTGSSTDTNGSFAIGKFGDWTHPSNYFDGIIDDVAIFNRALTETEISNLYTGNWPAVKDIIQAGIIPFAR